jgi:Tfp pilus assembly protein PilV
MRNFDMKMKRIQNQDGITLLEVLIAMIILTLSLLVLLNMAMVALDGNDWANHTTVATQLLQDKLEELRGDGFPVSGSDTVGDIARTWTVTAVSSHLRRVDVQVNWRDISDDQQTNSITSFIRTDSV